MIALTDLQKVVDQITVVDIPSLKVKEGEAAAVVGAVDCGKEVLFQLLTGATRPTTGSVRIAGKENRGSFLPVIGQKRTKTDSFLPLLSPLRGEKGAGGMREVAK